jgi:soluble lytic murein transglycosylase-like protein
VDAGHELRAGLLGAKTADERRQWTTLAMTLNAPVMTNVDTRTVRGVNPDDFPTPRLAPRGGYTIDKAMVYAIVRQESRFNADAHSHAGARGLMQLMPATAAFISGDDRLKSDTEALRNPATNLRLGQDYFKHLLDYQSPQGDVLRAVAAYNGGQRAVNRAVETAGSDMDPLMLIESLPAQETRDYVEKVVSGYWIYRRIFGEDSKTLDAVASGRRSAELTLDR